MEKAVCIDLDGVLASYDKSTPWDGLDIGKPIDGAKEFLDELSKKYKVIIHTARVTDEKTGELHLGRYKKLVWWLNKHGLKFSRIEKKPIAVAYIDDHAILCEPQIKGDKAFKKATKTTNKYCKEYEEGKNRKI
jgi:hypothetical protein